MSKHTPGPWRLVQLRGGSIQAIENNDGVRVAELVRWSTNHPDAVAERDANGDLLASAPDLLEALESAVSDLFYQIEAKHGAEAASKYPSIISARLAIAKARGKS